MNEKIINKLIAQNEHIYILPEIFENALIVDHNFVIKHISIDILKWLEYSENEIKLKSLNVLSHDTDLVALIKSQLRCGYFSKVPAMIRNWKQQPVKVQMSGFYLGMITDFNQIIIKLENVEAIHNLEKQLAKKTKELDQFFYRSFHDMRGPIATIQGLTNIADLESDPQKLKELFILVKKTINNLGQVLTNVQELVETPFLKSCEVNVIDFYRISNKLVQIFLDDIKEKNIKLNIEVTETFEAKINESAIIIILSKVIEFIHHYFQVVDESAAINIRYSLVNQLLILKVRTIGITIPLNISRILSDLSYIPIVNMKDRPMLRLYQFKKFLAFNQGDLKFAAESIDRHNLEVRFRI